MTTTVVTPVAGSLGDGGSVVRAGSPIFVLCRVALHDPQCSRKVGYS
jgi:hypothetical protein